jgi:branched-chain amino acid aminotransferase
MTLGSSRTPNPEPRIPLPLPLCWVNGLRVDPTGPALSVWDRGFTLADGCFETMRAYGGTIFRLDAHLARLAATAERLAILVPPHLDATIADVARAVWAERADATVRLTLTRGVGSGFATETGGPPTTVVSANWLKAIHADLYTRGLQVRIADGRRNEFAPTAGLKTLSYTDAVIALAAARAHGADDALLLDTEGHLSEGSASNVFLVIRGVVHTPPLRCGVLPGITRAAVLEILAGLDMPIEETPVPAGAVLVADEMFLTSSLREIAPVTGVDGRPVGTGTVGPITDRVRAAFQQLVGAEVADSQAMLT